MKVVTLVERKNIAFENHYAPPPHHHQKQKELKTKRESFRISRRAPCTQFKANLCTLHKCSRDTETFSIKLQNNFEGTENNFEEVKWLFKLLVPHPTPWNRLARQSITKKTPIDDARLGSTRLAIDQSPWSDGYGMLWDGYGVVQGGYRMVMGWL